MEIDVNTRFDLVPESVFKAKIAGMIVKLNKSMGNMHTEEECIYVSTEIWRPLYFKNRSLPLGILYRFYDEVLNGRITLKKITVQTMLSSLYDYFNKFKELERLNQEKIINSIEEQKKNENAVTVGSPIALAACWMITKRCDGVNLDNITTKMVAEYIEAGKNPDNLLKYAVETKK